MQAAAALLASLALMAKGALSGANLPMIDAGHAAVNCHTTAAVAEMAPVTGNTAAAASQVGFSLIGRPTSSMCKTGAWVGRWGRACTKGQGLSEHLLPHTGPHVHPGYTITRLGGT